MDATTYALAKPKVIDLTQFTTTDGNTFNDLILTMMMGSLDGNGALQTMTVNDKNHALRNELTTNRQVILSTNMGGAVAKAPASIAIENGVVGQCSVNSFMGIGVLFTIAFTIIFSGGTSDVVDLYVKATPATA